MSTHREATIPAAPTNVYQVLADAQALSALSGKGGAIGRAAGEEFTAFDGNVTGRQIELVPDERIVQAWRFPVWAEGTYSIVRFTLTPQNGQTRLVIDGHGEPVDWRDRATRGTGDGLGGKHSNTQRRTTAARGGQPASGTNPPGRTAAAADSEEAVRIMTEPVANPFEDGPELLDRIESESSSDDEATAATMRLLSHLYAGYPIERIIPLLHRTNHRAVRAGSFLASEMAERAAPLVVEMERLLDSPIPWVRHDAVEVIRNAAGTGHGHAIAAAIRLVGIPVSESRCPREPHPVPGHMAPANDHPAGACDCRDGRLSQRRNTAGTVPATPRQDHRRGTRAGRRLAARTGAGLAAAQRLSLAQKESVTTLVDRHHGARSPNAARSRRAPASGVPGSRSFCTISTFDVSMDERIAVLAWPMCAPRASIAIKLPWYVTIRTHGWSCSANCTSHRPIGALGICRTGGPRWPSWGGSCDADCSTP